MSTLVAETVGKVWFLGNFEHSGPGFGMSVEVVEESQSKQEESLN